MKKIAISSSFAKLFPKLLLEWDCEKNTHDPYKLSKGSSAFKVWWLCKEGHSYAMDIYSRTTLKYGCKICGNIRGAKKRVKKILNTSGSLEQNNPEIAKEWHPTKNGNLKPKNVTIGSNKKVFWKCKFGHVWEAIIVNRAGKAKTGCPYCTKRVSLGEVRVYSELLNFFDNTELHVRIKNLEVDIIIKELDLAIELDGYPWHKGREDRDISKNINLEKLGFKVFRLRDSELKKIKCNYSTFKANNVCIGDIKNILIFILKNYKLSENRFQKLNEYINYQENFLSQKLYEKILKTFPGSIKGKSLLDTHPEISDEWDFEKNFPLKPEDFTKGAHRKVYWICKQNPLHSWEATIKDRTVKNSKCPVCSRESRSGNKNVNYDHMKYKFIHNNKEIFFGTKFEFHKKFDIDRSSVTKLINGKRKSYLGWKLLKI